MQILEQIATKHQSPAPATRVREGEIEQYAGGERRQQTSALNMTEALRTFLACGIRKAISRCYLSELWGGPQNSIPPDS